MNANSTSQLVGKERCLEIVFPDKDSAPSKRSFDLWIQRKYFPVHRIGRRVFLDPVEVRSALDSRFKIHATPDQ